jgi:hypothetical protein
VLQNTSELDVVEHAVLDRSLPVHLIHLKSSRTSLRPRLKDTESLCSLIHIKVTHVDSFSSYRKLLACDIYWQFM